MCVWGLCASQTARHLPLMQGIGLKREVFRLSGGGLCLTRLKSDKITVWGRLGVSGWGRVGGGGALDLVCGVWIY